MKTVKIPANVAAALKLKTIKTKISSALKPIDQKVISAFLDGEELEGRILYTDGKVLEKISMGRQVLAKNNKGNINWVGNIAVKSDEVIYRALKKATPAKLFHGI